MKSLLKLGFFLGCILALGVALIRFWGAYSTGTGSDPRKAVLYEVKRTSKPSQIAHDLEAQGMISSAWAFHWYGRFTHQNGKIKAGDYRFTAAMSPRDIFKILCSGISYGIPLVVPEGDTVKQIAATFEAIRPGAGREVMALAFNKKFIASIWPQIWKLDVVGNPPPVPSSLEGYLFPETYAVTRQETVPQILAIMAEKSAHLWTPQWVARARELKMSIHEVVTLASIVEKETGADFERPLVSSVFHNRLRKHMRLQTDPTVIYGIKNYNGNITRRDLERPTPYNTYVIPGLPPGPISNPGRAAVEAALYPKESTYLFFASHNDGTHEFTSTYEDHQKAVAKFQLDPKAREGKSWRDLKKNQAAHQK